MSISNISSSAASSLIQQLTSSSAKKAATTSSTGSTAGSDSSRVSTMGDLMKQLDDLATSDPEQFKAVTADIADQLKELASTLTGDEASKVGDMASQFADAAKSGDAKSLRPSKPPPPPGPPPQGAASYEKAQGLATDGDDIRSQIDGILSNALSRLSASS